LAELGPAVTARADDGRILREERSVNPASRIALAVCVPLAVAVTACASSAHPGGALATTRVSVSTAGRQANAPGFADAIGASGRYVVFHSEASNLVAGDTNGLTDVFLHDLRTGRTERVSVGGAGQGDGASFSASIDGSGRFVLFGSDATNLVGGDTNDVTDVFVRDRTAGTTRRISLTAAGGQANGGSLYGEISADGRVAAFVSDARNLVRADTNRSPDVFVRGLAP
jgi:Tol biopolymer transport system component